MIFPSLYPIVDFDRFASEADPVRAVLGFAEKLLQGGATIIQYRDKTGDTMRMLGCARELRRITQGRATLIINDRVDICLAAGPHGVPLPQHNPSPAPPPHLSNAPAQQR